MDMQFLILHVWLNGFVRTSFCFEDPTRGNYTVAAGIIQADKSLQPNEVEVQRGGTFAAFHIL